MTYLGFALVGEAIISHLGKKLRRGPEQTGCWVANRQLGGFPMFLSPALHLNSIPLQPIQHSVFSHGITETASSLKTECHGGGSQAELHMDTQ